KDLPGATKARNHIVSTALDYLAALGSEAPGDKDLSLEIGDAYRQVARLQGVPQQSNLGKFADADDSLRKGEALVESVLARDPANRKALLQSAQIANDRIAIADAQQRNAFSLEQIPKVDRRLEALGRRPDLQPYELNQMTYIYTNVAVAYEQALRLDDAIREARHAEQIARGRPSESSYRYQALGVLGNALHHSGDLEGSLEAV